MNIFFSLTWSLLLILHSAKNQAIPLSFCSIVNSGRFPDTPLVADILTQQTNDNPLLLNGYELEVRHYDSAGDSDLGLLAALECAGITEGSERAEFVMGDYHSHVSNIIQVVASKHNLTQISPAATSPNLSGLPTFNRVCPHDVFQARAIARICSEFGWKKVGVLHTQDAYGSDLASEFNTACKTHDIDVVASASFQQKEEDTSSQVELLKSSGVNVIFLSMISSDVSTVLIDLEEQGMLGYPHIYLGCDGWTGMLIDEELKLLEGSLGTTFYSPVDGQQYKDWIDEWGQMYEDEPERVGNKEMPDILTPYAYDAFWLGINALNDLLLLKEHCTSPDEIDTTQCENLRVNGDEMTLNQIVRTMSLPGVTGEIQLEPNGDRDYPWAIQNIQIQGDTHKWIQVGGVTTTDITYLETDEIFWPGGRTEPPPDEPLYIIELCSIPLGAVYTVIVFAALQALGCLLIVPVNYINKHAPIIKMSSPVLNNVTLFGSMMAFVCAILFGIDENLVSESSMPSVCMAQSWFLVLSFTLVFAPMFAKTYRIHKIFSNKDLSRVPSVKTSQLLLVVAVFIVADMIVLLTYQAMSPLQWIKRDILPEIVHPEDPNLITRRVYGVCESELSRTFSWVFLAFKGMILLYGANLAFEVRNIEIKALNDSKPIGFAIYSVLIVSVLLVPIVFSIEQDVAARYGFIAGGIMFLALLVDGLVFIPKLRAMYIGEADTWTEGMSSKRSRSVQSKSKSGSHNVTREKSGSHVTREKSGSHVTREKSGSHITETELQQV